VYAGSGGNPDDQNPAPSVQNCTIDNNVFGLYFDGLGNSSSPIQNNSISNNSSHGIYLYNSCPQSIFGNTISNNGGDGISLSHSGGGIAGNTISSNGMNGIYCYNRSNPDIRDNIILSNRQAGVQCDYYSPATLLAASSGNGRNVIRRNSVSIGADYSSNMIAGYSFDYGLNSMYGEVSVNVEAGHHSHVEAECNYWGGALTPSRHTYGGGTLDCGNVLIDDPNAGTGKIIARNGRMTGEPQNQMAGTGASNDAGSFLDLNLVAILQSMLDGSCADAIPQYIQRYEAEKDSAKMQYILTQLGECCLTTRKSDFVDFLNSDVRPGLSIDDPLYATTLELENFFLIRDGRYDEAIVNFEALAGRFARDSSTVRHALFGLWSLSAQGLKDTQKANEYLEQLKTEFPKDDLTRHARLLSGEIDGSSGPGRASVDLPNRTELLANFPNPFNLSTTIRYGLPQRSLVTLAIYNVLGQQVAVLVDREQEPGYYDVKFDGTNSASGLYFYRLIAKDFVQTRKLLLVK
jgi:parallel beta-helix repeat protein